MGRWPEAQLGVARDGEVINVDKVKSLADDSPVLFIVRAEESMILEMLYVARNKKGQTNLNAQTKLDKQELI